jgi:GTPase SAR1 family protein
VIVVYDTTNRQSFENVATWLDEAEMNIGGANPSESVFLLVGHKADLEDKRQVLYEGNYSFF